MEALAERESRETCRREAEDTNRDMAFRIGHGEQPSLLLPSAKASKAYQKGNFSKG